MAEYSVVNIYHIIFIHSSVNGHLGCFHDSDVVHSSIMNIRVHSILLNHVFLQIHAQESDCKIMWWCIFIYFILLYNTVLVFHTSTWIHHGCTWVPNPEPHSHLPPYTLSLGHPSAAAPSILYPASNLDWRFVSYIILYMFQCHSPKSSHPLPLPQSSKDCSKRLYFFCCLAYRVIITIFLNSIYMC